MKADKGQEGKVEDVIEPRSEYGNLPPEQFDLASEVRSATDKRMADHLKSCEMARELKERGIVVRTNFQYMHWVAVDDQTYDGPGSPIGTGKTEQEAIEDLAEQLEEKS